MPKRKADAISVTQLFRMFPDENACYAWLDRTRWGDQPVCPHCGGMDNISQPPSKPHHYWHKDCRKQFTVTIKTCMHATKRPLQDWIFTIYTVLTARKGVSAMQLSKELGCQYRTAWHMLHRIREACAGGDFSLDRVVEVDETYVGGREHNKHASKKLRAGRGTVGKTPVVGARQRGGMVMAKPVERTDTPTLIGFVESAVAPGSTTYTDDARAYDALPNAFNRYAHRTVKHSQGMTPTPTASKRSGSLQVVGQRNVVPHFGKTPAPLRRRGHLQAERRKLRSGHPRPYGVPSPRDRRQAAQVRGSGRLGGSGTGLGGGGGGRGDAGLGGVDSPNRSSVSRGEFRWDDGIGFLGTFCVQLAVDRNRIAACGRKLTGLQIVDRLVRSFLVPESLPFDG